MTMPIEGVRVPATIVDKAGNSVALIFDITIPGWRLAVDGGGGGGGSVVVTGVTPGTIIATPADTAVGVAATVALPAIPAGTRRVTVQVTGGDATTRIRVRQTGAGAGRGKLLVLLGSTIYGGADGALMALEVENVAGPIAAVMVQFEQN
jgi:hypothetical protein